MRRIAVVGAGKIGATVAGMLAGTGDYQVLALDRSADALAGVADHARIETAAVAIDDPAALAVRLAGAFAVINCAPFHLTAAVARAAAAAKAHYLDLTEDVAASRVVRDLAAIGDTAFIPQCGLAP